MTDDWDGVERRAEDARFTKAMADVRSLKAATTDLAEAVKVKTDSLHRILYQILAVFIAMAILIIIATLWGTNHVTGRINGGHDTIVCVLELTAEQKAALGDLACK